MKVLIIGSGGREHALAWKVKQSPLVDKVYCAPGNGGTAQIAENVNIAFTDIEALLAFAVKEKIDLTVVGPEAPLAAGIVDQFENEGLKIFGPSKDAAQLESSKVFAKEFMHNCNIPTALFRKFYHVNEAKEFLNQAQFPLVVKADGLAAGKGVIVCKDLAEGLKAVQEIMENKIFQDAGEKIVIEECLVGEEASILAISDGEEFVVMETSQDHKRIFDDDVGPNTGGMGAYSPAPLITNEALRNIEARIIEPTIWGMRRGGVPFKGVLYVGIMMTKQGPMTLEYNVRLGDPEAQAVLPRLKTDLVEVMLASCDGRIKDIDLEWDERACVCVVMSSKGYPGEYKTGMEIKGLKSVKNNDPSFVFHAGTKAKGEKIVSSGGRVCGVTSLGKGLQKAIDLAYETVEKIKFDGCFFRRDIGAKALTGNIEAREISSRR